jgi:hypothetical protein
MSKKNHQAILDMIRDRENNVGAPIKRANEKTFTIENYSYTTLARLTIDAIRLNSEIADIFDEYSDVDITEVTSCINSAGICERVYVHIEYQ